MALFSGGFALACAVGIYLLPTAFYLPAVIVALLLLLAAIALRKAWSRALALLLMGLSVGLLWLLAYQGYFYRGAEQLQGQSMTVELLATGYPADWGEERLALDVEFTTPDGLVRNAQLRYPNQALTIEPGDRVSATVYVQDARQSANGESLYESSQGYVYVLFTYGKVQVEKGDMPLRFYPKLLAQRASLLCDELFGELAFFFSGILLGDKSGLSTTWTSYFNRSGLAHVLVVSGLHIGFLVSMAELVCRRRRRLSFALALLMLAIYVPLVGFTPSVVRAAVMWLLLLIAPLLGRERDPLTSLGFALLFTLLQNPYALASWSLQFSYASTLGIVLYARPIERYLMQWQERIKHRPGKAVYRWMISSASVSIAVSIFTLPIMALQVGQVSLLSLFANLLAVWAASFAFRFGLFALLLAPLLLPLARLLALLAQLFGRWILLIAEGIGSLPFATITLEKFSYRIWFIFTYLLILLFIIARKNLNIRPLIIACPSVILLLFLFFMESYAVQGTDAVLAVLDIGQGQCVYYQSDGYTVFVDCGGTSSSDAAQKAADYLRSSGETSVDLIVLTHYDADHAGGVPSLLDWLEVGAVALPDMQSDNKYRLAIEEHATENGTELLYVTQDCRLQTGNTEITLYAPYSATSSNDAGICILLTQNDFDILITGDVTSDMERRLIKYGNLPDIEILIAGHHGSKYSTGEELLAATTPEVVVISCGMDNSYGHPHEETLARIEAAGAALYRTDLQGDIILTERQVALYGG